MFKKFRNVLMAMLAFVVMAGFAPYETSDEALVLELPDRDFVAFLVGEVVWEYREQADFDLDAMLEDFGFERDDFVQYIYRGASDPEIALEFILQYGDIWLIYLIEITILDIIAAFEEHGPDVMATVLQGIFEWAWTVELLEILTVVEAADLEARFSKELSRIVVGVIDSEILGANLNLFVRNNCTQSLEFIFQVGYVDGDENVVLYYREVEIAAGDSFTVQLPYSLIDGNLLGFFLNGAESPSFSGELAFRFTNSPLGYEQH
jgi:hypothetical protein